MSCPTRAWLTSVLGGDRQNCTSAIFAFSMRSRPETVCAKRLLNTTPCTSSVSSTVPLFASVCDAGSELCVHARKETDGELRTSVKEEPRPVNILELADDPNVLEVDGARLLVGHGEDSVHHNRRNRARVQRDDLGVEGSAGAFQQHVAVRQLDRHRHLCVRVEKWKGWLGSRFKF